MKASFVSRRLTNPASPTQSHRWKVVNDPRPGLSAAGYGGSSSALPDPKEALEKGFYTGELRLPLDRYSMFMIALLGAALDHTRSGPPRRLRESCDGW
jgi:hypothetical protein